VLVTATVSEFFSALVTHLEQDIDVSYVMVSEAIENPPERLKTLVIWAVLWQIIFGI